MQSRSILWYLRLMVWLVLAICRGIPVVSVPSDCRAGSDALIDVVLISNAQDRFTVADVSGVSYQQALERLEGIVARHGEPKDFFGGGLAPAMRQWHRDDMPHIVDWYHHALTGIVEKYFHACVFDRFVEDHPDALKAAGIDWQDVNEYVQALADRQNAKYEAVTEWLDKGRPVADAERELQAKYPEIELSDDRQSLIRKSAHQFLVIAACLPWKLGDAPAPWVLWDVKSKLMRHLVEAEIANNLEKYRSLLQEDLEVRTYFVVTHDPGQSDVSLRRLLQTLMDVDGSVAMAGVKAANKYMAELGNPLRISDIRRYSQRQLLSERGLDRRLDAGECFRFKGLVLVTFQQAGERPTIDESPYRGRALYGYVSTLLQLPLIEQCRSKLETPEFVLLPDNGEIDDGLGGTYLLSNVWGSPLPLFIETHVPTRKQDEK